MAEDMYVLQRKHENIMPIELPNKSKLYHDLQNIEHSWTGRMDANIGNTFIMEAVQLLINSIELFEMGYFDCAYFSLRSAVDISTTMVFLCDIEKETGEKYLNDWDRLKDFPARYRMIDELSKDGSVFVDMTKNMPSFFKHAEEISKILNKYVHKQGMHNFYVSRNHPIFHVKSQDIFIKNFNCLLKEVICIVAVMRLAIDPFPILLMDPEILYRCFDSMTEPYSEDFVKEYIDSKYIEGYKKTNFYISTRIVLENEEKKNKAVFNVVKYHHIDTTRYDDIASQFHLMSEESVIATIISCACEKIVKVYACGVLLMYFTNRNTNRKSLSWSSEQFDNFSKSKQKYNQKFDEAYISVFSKGENDYYAEHNEMLEDAEIAFIESKIKGYYQREKRT